MHFLSYLAIHLLNIQEIFSWPWRLNWSLWQEELKTYLGIEKRLFHELMQQSLMCQFRYKNFQGRQELLTKIRRWTQDYPSRLLFQASKYKYPSIWVSDLIMNTVYESHHTILKNILYMCHQISEQWLVCAANHAWWGWVWQIFPHCQGHGALLWVAGWCTSCGQVSTLSSTFFLFHIYRNV